jgi:hypothetical protein
MSHAPDRPGQPPTRLGQLELVTGVLAAGFGTLAMAAALALVTRHPPAAGARAQGASGAIPEY